MSETDSNTVSETIPGTASASIPAPSSTAAFPFPLGLLVGILPSEFLHHTRAAQRELLLAARSLIDAGIEMTRADPTARQDEVRRISIEES